MPEIKLQKITLPIQDRLVRAILAVLVAIATAPALALQTVHAASPLNLREDIPWSAGMAGVADIAAAYNNGRRNEEQQLSKPTNSMGNLTMPSQQEWDAKSVNEKGLYLLNAERVARSGLPFENFQSDVIKAAEDYAQVLLTRNVFGHDADGDPYSRLDRQFGTCREFLTRAENLTFDGTRGTDPQLLPLALERAIYRWIYNDKSSSWGHREATLLQDVALTGQTGTGFKNNVGSASSEGFIGFAVVTSTTYWPSSDPGMPHIATLIVMEMIDPAPLSSCVWNRSTVPLTPRTWLPVITR